MSVVWDNTNTMKITDKSMYKDINDYIIEKLKDPEEAELYLNAALEDYMEDFDAAALVIVLRNLVMAQGSVTEFAKRAGINRQHMYKIFNNEVKPQFDTISEILKALG